MINWKSDKRKISDLIPAKYNPRKAGDQEWHDLNASLDQFNLADPIIINKDNTVIGGHFRLKVLQARGDKEVDVRVPDRLLTPDEERRLNLRLNKNNGSWDFDMLANFDEDMLKEVGFTAAELDEIFQLDESDKDKADACGALPAESSIKPGDMFQLGRHRLMCGDATSAGDIALLMDGKKAAMIFTDPPYNVNYTGGMGAQEKNAREGILNDKMEKPAFREFLLAISRNMIENCTGGIREEIVADFFGGSGSTLIACELLNRTCYMSELDPRYCQVIINRWEEYTGLKAEKLQEVGV